jgi:hypothetical protein
VSDISPNDLAEVERIVRAAGTSFYRGMAVLPKPRRAAMYAVYAFCRLVDDIVDEPGEDASKRAALADWRGRIAGLYEGRAEDPVSRVLLAAVRAYGLRREDFLAVIDGMEMDGAQAIVAPPLAELDLYCDRVAAAVGGCRCAPSATARPLPTRWRTISAGHCSSPTSCATSPRILRAAGSICRPSSSPRRRRPAPARRWHGRSCPRSARNWLIWPSITSPPPVPPWRVATAAPCAPRG